MIAAVSGHNFKGGTFSAPLGPLNLVVGPNGSGKSRQSQALQLAVLGYVPGAAKQNGGIMGAFHDGQGRDLRAGITLDSGQKMERRFARSKSGTVSQELYVNGSKVKPDDFAKAFFGVAVIDLSAFLALSDQKKVDELFRLFPPDGDVKDLTEKIQSLAERVNGLERKERDSLSAMATNQAQKAKIELPAGSMADKLAEIERAEADLRQAREDLHAAKIEAARAEERAEADLRQAAVSEAAANQPPRQVPIPWAADRLPEPNAPGPHGKPLAPIADVAAILERVLATMGRSGCEVCAARMVIKSELAKARQGQSLEAA